MEPRFEDFYRREQPAVYRAAYLATGSRDAALDATQEAFKRAWIRWLRLRRHPWAGGWVMTTALNLCRRANRERNRGRTRVVDDRLGSAPGPGADRVDVQRALAALPFRQREAAILFYLGDLPVATVAQLMGVSEGAVKAHLHAARAKLRASLEVLDA